MKTSVIQSLIDRNANQISAIETTIKNHKGYVKAAYAIGYNGIMVSAYKADLSKQRQTLKKIVAIQKELKKELADNIACQAYSIFLADYEGVN